MEGMVGQPPNLKIDFRLAMAESSENSSLFSSAECRMKLAL